MKRIWAVVSRLGTILLTIGFAFLLLSLLAQTVYSPQGYTMGIIDSQQFQPLNAHYMPFNKAYFSYFSILSTHEMYNITINSNVSLNVYIIDMNTTELPSSDQLNQTLLDNILQTKSVKILWQGNIANGTIMYTPLTDSNLTIIASNPSNEGAKIHYQITSYHLYVPRILGIEIAAATVPLGFVLAAPLLKNMISVNYRKIKNRLLKK